MTLPAANLATLALSWPKVFVLMLAAPSFSVAQYSAVLESSGYLQKDPDVHSRLCFCFVAIALN